MRIFWKKKYCSINDLFIKFFKYYICLLLFILLPNICSAQNVEQNFNNLSSDLPALSVQANQDTINITPYLRYAHGLGDNDAQNIFAQKDKFKPYNPNELILPLGKYWFLLSFGPVQDKNVSAFYLDVSNFLPRNSKILILPKDAKNWQILDDVYTREKFLNSNNTELGELKVSFFSSGLYDLTGLRDGGELLIYSPGVPSIWFAPVLILPAKASITFDRRIMPIILVLLIALMLCSLWRGLREEGDARIWASLLTFIALIQYSFGVAKNPEGDLPLWDSVGIICASISIFLLPHIGRHLMVSEKNTPNLDGFLQFIALPAIFPLAVIFTPLPQYFPLLRLMPLWGIYAFLPFIFCIPAVFRQQKGAILYSFFCLCIGFGALVSFSLKDQPVFSVSPQIGLCLAMIAMFLAPRQSEKNIYEKIYDDHTDYIDEFAENNVAVREVFFRVEEKLREPFDRILREACFLDFDTKAEDLSEALAILSEKHLEQNFDKNSINAINDINSRAQRLKNHSTALVYACKELSELMGNMPKLAQKSQPYYPSHELFNLKTLVLNACDGIREEAQAKQVGLGWYIAPQMGLLYRADLLGLKTVLELLLKDAIRATDRGMISVRVRRANDPNPGHIVFTISDSGKGRPPIQRSPLTLIKAWELSTNYNGQVELNSSTNGLSFSFSIECVAMDAMGEKPLAFASLDDVAIKSTGKNKLLHSSEKGESGGNLVFSKETEKKNDLENKSEIEDNLKTENSVKNTEENVIEKNGNIKPKLQDLQKGEINQTVQIENNKKDEIDNKQASKPLFTRRQTVVSNELRKENEKRTILLICPLAIQRQNLAWYLNQHEIWESLDVDSALAFYQKKPAKLVLVHSALSANGCNAVLAGIRQLEDSLGLPPAPFVGLYQSAKDMEFLRLAGCKHLLPANIGREDLCVAVAEIMQDPFIAPISHIDAEHEVIKKLRDKERDKEQEEIKAKAIEAVNKRLNIKKVSAGQVIDGAVVDLSEHTVNFDNSSEIRNKQNSVLPNLSLPNQELIKENTGRKIEVLDEIIDDTIYDNEYYINIENKNDLIDEKIQEPIENLVEESDFIKRDKGFETTVINNFDKIKDRHVIISSAKEFDENTDEEFQPYPHAETKKKGFLGKMFGFLQKKPKQVELKYHFDVDDLVGEPTPIIKDYENQEVKKDLKSEIENKFPDISDDHESFIKNKILSEISESQESLIIQESIHEQEPKESEKSEENEVLEDSENLDYNKHLDLEVQNASKELYLEFENKNEDFSEDDLTVLASNFDFAQKMANMFEKSNAVNKDDDLTISNSLRKSKPQTIETLGFEKNLEMNTSSKNNENNILNHDILEDNKEDMLTFLPSEISRDSKPINLVINIDKNLQDNNSQNSKMDLPNLSNQENVFISLEPKTEEDFKQEEIFNRTGLLIDTDITNQTENKHFLEDGLRFEAIANSKMKSDIIQDIKEENINKDELSDNLKGKNTHEVNEVEPAIKINQGLEVEDNSKSDYLNETQKSENSVVDNFDNSQEKQDEEEKQVNELPFEQENEQLDEPKDDKAEFQIRNFEKMRAHIVNFKPNKEKIRAQIKNNNDFELKFEINGIKSKKKKLSQAESKELKSMELSIGKNEKNVQLSFFLEQDNKNK